MTITEMMVQVAKGEAATRGRNYTEAVVHGEDTEATNRRDMRNKTAIYAQASLISKVTGVSRDSIYNGIEDIYYSAMEAERKHLLSKD